MNYHFTTDRFDKTCPLGVTIKSLAERERENAKRRSIYRFRMASRPFHQHFQIFVTSFSISRQITSPYASPQVSGGLPKFQVNPPEASRFHSPIFPRFYYSRSPNRTEKVREASYQAHRPSVQPHVTCPNAIRPFP